MPSEPEPAPPRPAASVSARPRPALYALPAALWLAATAVAITAGVRFTFYWGLLQLLDRSALLDRPLEALALLHAQPPGLNALLALILRAADVLGVPPAGVAWPFFAPSDWPRR